MKVKHGLALVGVSLTVLGVSAFGINDMMNVTDKEVEQYARENMKVVAKVEDKVPLKKEGVLYTLVTDGDNPYSFTIKVKDGYPPTFEETNFKQQTKVSKVSKALHTADVSYKMYNFTLGEQGVTMGVDDKGAERTKITMKYAEDLSIFGFNDKTYSDIYNMLKVVNNIAKTTPEIKNPYVYLDDGNSGVIALTNLDQFTSPKKVQEVLKKSVQSQMLDTSKDKKKEKEEDKETTLDKDTDKE